MKVKIFNKKPVQEIEISSDVFGVKPNHLLVSLATQRILANRRKVVAHTKTRSEVAGGGRKPFKQKGTGRARAGSTRSPIWIGGGITFGPNSDRNYQKKMPKKMASQAIKILLSEKFKSGKIVVVDKMLLPEIGTSKVQDFLEKLPIEEGRVLVVLAKTNVNLELSAANLPYIKVVQVSGMNLLDLAKHDYLVLDKDALLLLDKSFGSKK